MPAESGKDLGWVGRSRRWAEELELESADVIPNDISLGVQVNVETSRDSTSEVAAQNDSCSDDEEDEQCELLESWEGTFAEDFDPDLHPVHKPMAVRQPAFGSYQ